MTKRDTEIVWPEAFKRLKADPVFGPLVKTVGPVRLPVERLPLFPYLVSSIVYQQLAGRAAATIHGRVVEALNGDVSAAAILKTADDLLRGAGLSRNKLLAIQDLAARVDRGELDLDTLEDLSDADVEARLVTVRGIGPWTARMLLLFRLRRPDVWPVEDLGVRAGWAKLHGTEHPDPKQLRTMGEVHRPWRSAVAWYCWRAVDG